MNSSFEDLEGRMGLNRLWKLVPQAREKRNKWVEVRSGPGCWKFDKKQVTVESCVL